MNPRLHQSNNDFELIRRLQKGSLEAFELLYEKYSKKVYAFGMKYLRSAAETEELVQSVFLKIWENHKIIDKELSFRSYLFTITYNDICKLFRKRNYHYKYIHDVQQAHPSSTSQTEEGLDYQSTLERLELIIDRLPERQKDVFRKSRIEGKATKEIAKELNLSPGTVDNYITAALNFIRGKLHKEDLALILLVSLYIF